MSGWLRCIAATSEGGGGFDTRSCRTSDHDSIRFLRNMHTRWRSLGHSFLFLHILYFLQYAATLLKMLVMLIH